MKRFFLKPGWVLDKRVDREQKDVIYIGLSASHVNDVNKPVWQICRVVFDSKREIHEYADGGQFTQVWANRRSLFGPVVL